MRDTIGRFDRIGLYVVDRNCLEPVVQIGLEPGLYPPSGPKRSLSLHILSNRKCKICLYPPSGPKRSLSLHRPSCPLAATAYQECPAGDNATRECDNFLLDLAMVDCLASSGTPIIDHYRRCLDTMCGVDTSALNSTLDYISDNCSENGKSGGGKWREKKREKAKKKSLVFFFFFFSSSFYFLFFLFLFFCLFFCFDNSSSASCEVTGTDNTSQLFQTCRQISLVLTRHNSFRRVV